MDPLLDNSEHTLHTHWSSEQVQPPQAQKKKKQQVMVFAQEWRECNELEEAEVAKNLRLDTYAVYTQALATYSLQAAADSDLWHRSAQAHDRTPNIPNRLSTEGLVGHITAVQLVSLCTVQV
jgi:O-glycosyl hydrolase